MSSSEHPWMLSKVTDGGIAPNNRMSTCSTVVLWYELALAILATMELCYVNGPSLYTWSGLITGACAGHAANFYYIAKHREACSAWKLHKTHFSLITAAAVFGLVATALQTGMTWIIMDRPTSETKAVFNKDRYSETLPAAVDVRLIAGFWIIMAYQVLKVSVFLAMSYVAQSRHEMPVYDDQAKRFVINDGL